MQTPIDAAPDNGLVSVLIVDDDPDSLALLAHALVNTRLAKSGLEILTAANPAAALEIATRRSPQIVIVTPQPGAPELLKRLTELDSSVRLIQLPAHYSAPGLRSDPDICADIDYPDIDCPDVEPGAARAPTLPHLRERIVRLAREVRRQRSRTLADQSRHNADFGGIVGRSPLMWEVVTRIRRIAPYYQTILITGETGTGKDLGARALHRLSPLAGAPFVPVNCAHASGNALETLLEGEIFARSGGTLFLDEIGEMQIATQARFLRMLRVWEMCCPGWRKGEKPDIRVIAATKHDLRSLVAQQRFPEDLCRRLTRVEIRMPRLADRMQDFSLLQNHFIARFAALHGKRVAGLTRAAHFRLAGYPWPGNVRELENVLRHAVTFCRGGRIDVQDLPQYLRTQTEKAA